MVHKSSLIPAFSKFIDENILSHYPATSMKRILMAGGISLYMKQNEGIIDTIANNPLFAGLGVVTEDGLVDIDKLKDTLKCEINKAGFMRLSIPLIGDIDFTTEDVDTLYRNILQVNDSMSTPQPQVLNTGGVY